MKKKLYDLAHCRAGDKGDTSILSVFAYRAEDFALIKASITPNSVKQHLAHIVTGDIYRFELPQLNAMQFVCEHALGGGVTTSLALDAHGKSLSAALLEMAVDVEGAEPG